MQTFQNGSKKTEHKHTVVYNKIHKFILKIAAKLVVTHNIWLFEKTCSSISMYEANRLWKSELKRIISICFKSNVMIPKQGQWYQFGFFIASFGSQFLFLFSVYFCFNKEFLVNNMQSFSLRSYKKKLLIIFDCILIVLLCVNSGKKHLFSVSVS